MSRSLSPKFRCVVAALSALGVAGGAAQAAIVYANPDDTYSQSFNTLPNTPENVSLGNSPNGWTNDTAAPAAGQFSIVGWHIFHALTPAEGGADGHQRVRVGPGNNSTGSFYSFGPTGGNVDRALGVLASNTLGAAGGNQYWGMRLTNNTGQVLDTFTLGYDGEQWRDGGNATPITETTTVQYSTTAASIQDTPAYTNAPATLNFVSPVFANTTSGAAVDGNGAGKTTIAPVSVTGVNWQPGADLWIRWVDVNVAGNDHGMAIDAVSFSASVPEPTSATALLAAGAAFAARRRRRHYAR